MNPEGRIALHIAAAEPCPTFDFHQKIDAQRSERRGIERLAACVIGDLDTDVIKQQVPPRLLSWKSFELSMAACPDAHYDHEERAAGNPSHLSLATASCNATISCV